MAKLFNDLCKGHINHLTANKKDNIDESGDWR